MKQSDLELKFLQVWSSMKASYFGPEPLILQIDEDGEIHLETFSSFQQTDQDGLFVEGSGKTISGALEDFAKKLDSWHFEVEN